MSAVIINVDTALTDVPIIEIGKQGENEATQVVFDVSDLIDTFGSGTAYVVVQRRGDAEPYLLDNTQQSSDKVTWTVSNVDTDVYGMGRVQLFWMIGDQVAKSVNYQFYVEEALGNPTDAPVVPGGWISEKIGDLDELTTTAKENLVDAINEVNGNTDTNATNIAANATAIGTLANLTTTEKSNLVGAINEVNALVDGVTDDVEGLSTDVEGLTGDVETLQTQMETKAEVDGLYEDMTVGNAEQLIASDYVTDKAPYLFRKTGGSTDVGNREYDTLVGASAVWNQLAGSTDTSVTVQSGHKYLSKISGTFALGSSDGTAITVDGTNGDMVVDLTKFFGSSTIPDYVYTLEQSTAGSGVAWLRQYFPKLFEYHEYDAGTLKSVEGVESHDTVGFNQWDESTAESNYIYSKAGVKTAGNNLSCGMIRVLPSTSYYLKAPHYESIWNAVFFDAEKNGLNDAVQVATGQSGMLFTTPSNCHYVGLNMQTSDKNDICINLSNSGYRNGEYEPYWKRSYPLDSTWVGRGIYKLGSDGKPYADGDIYASDGTVTVNYTERAYQSGDESLADAITDGTNTVVKLSTPTTTTLTPFQSPQICDDFGTEEYVTDCLIPVGHETKYPANLRDKVQHLPDLSNLGNGNYIINQTGTQMSLIPTTSIIPSVPTEDGTYTLKCTVASGTPTLTWEVDS